MPTQDNQDVKETANEGLQAQTNSGKPANEPPTVEVETNTVTVYTSDNPFKKAPNSNSTFSQRLQADTYERLYNLRENFGFGNDPQGFIVALMDALEKPEKEVQTVTETVTVEKELSENQLIIDFSPKEFRLLSLIQQYRFKDASRKAKPGELALMERKQEVIRKSFFHRSRLLNLDSNFLTGIPQDALD
jgi:hypothetical protein